MDFTLGLITGAYVVFALIVFYIVYIIEVKLDLPGIMNNHAVHQHSVGLNNNQTNENILTKFPEISQTRLRHMVESIIAEMLATPNLSNVNVSELELNTHKNGNGRPQHCHRYRTEHYFEPRAYQDFLTTTVLNKISHKEANVRRFSESTPDLCSSNIDVNFNMEDRSTSSNSSLGPTSAFSYADAERSPKVIKDLDRESTLNDYIASHMVPLPDLSNAMTESEDDDNASISSSILIEGNWEDNWLFRKKRPSITTSMTGSIGMLIPAPKDDVRAQIGDKTTDEISDLSEMESDTDDSSLKIYSSLDPRSDRILNKHLIGGQNTKGILDELIETASLVSNTSLPRSESNYFETMNKHVLEVASKTEAFNSCIASNSPQEEEIKLKSKPKNYYEDHLTPETENNSLSDQLRSDINRARKSTQTTTESNIDAYNNDQGISHTNKCNNSFINTTNLTNGSYPNLTPCTKSNGKQGQHFIYNSNYERDNHGEEDDVIPLRKFVPGNTM
uniref:Spindle pole body protein pcp1 n=1 Tax=Zeugodacus cucurbitae TaxID=28588 RepID=A0A0A1X8W5_ZEUCU